MKTRTLTIAALSLASMAIAATAAMSDQVLSTTSPSDQSTLSYQHTDEAITQSENGLGTETATWSSVPEPRSAALGAIGLSIILLRRRK